MKRILLCILVAFLSFSIWYVVVSSEEKGWCECMGHQPGIDTEYIWFRGCKFGTNPYENLTPEEWMMYEVNAGLWCEEVYFN